MKLLAPNGKPSNLNEQQWQLVRTPEFKRWFGDWEKAYETGNYDNISKVIGYNMKGFSGEPLICSHSSYDKFNQFKTPTFFQEGEGGGAYGDTSDEYYVNYNVFLNIKNPLELRSSFLKDKFTTLISEIYKNAGLDDDEYKNRMEFAEKYEDGYGLFKLFEKPYWKNEYGYNWEWVFDYCKKNGYDGFVMRDSDQSMQYYITTWVALYPEQIKLADGSNTTFDGNNPDIRFKEGGGIENGSVEFIKWYVDWYKNINRKMNILFSLPSVIAPFNEKNVVILDVFEKIDQNIDAKSYLNEIIEKADKYEVTIYLEPKPRHKYFQDNSQKKNKITREYLIDYYEKFGFQLTPNKKFMKRLPIKKYANGESSNFSYEIGGVLHGSPYDFERFSTEKIGTGEGAQAFGWGLYFTNLEDIARKYTKAGEGAIFIDKTPLSKRARFQKLPQDEKIEVEQLLRDIANGELTRNELFGMAAYRKGYYLTTYNFIRDAKEVKFSPEATLYKVSLHKGKTPEQYTWLEWDKIIDKSINTKLIEQAKKEGILKEREGKTPVISKVPTGAYFTNDNISGQDLYENLTVAFGSDKEASLFLLRAGIDGIKYPAESISRGATSDTARGFNYVVFDENAVTIEEKTKFKKGGNTEWNYEIGGL